MALGIVRERGGAVVADYGDQVRVYAAAIGGVSLSRSADWRPARHVAKHLRRSPRPFSARAAAHPILTEAIFSCIPSGLREGAPRSRVMQPPKGNRVASRQGGLDGVIVG